MPKYHLTTTAIMLDADHFKEYNDTSGHQAGGITASGNLITLTRSPD